MRDPGTDSDDAPAFTRLDAALDRALGPWRAHRGELALLFSGGVDSSLLAWELRTVPGLRLVTVGLRGSPDLDAAESAAGRLGVVGSISVVSEDEVRSTGRRIATEIQGIGRVRRSVLTSLALALAHAGRAEAVCGQGADELFLGYAHFRGLGPAEAEARSNEDWQRLLLDDWPRAQRIAALFARRIGAPYLDPAFAAVARSVPIDRRMPGSEAMGYFRAWARHRGLPEALARRPKRAMQFGTGVDRVLRSEA